VISCSPGDVERVLSLLSSKNVPYHRLGVVATATLSMKTSGSEFSWPVATIYDDWFNSIRRAVESEAEPVRSL
jgi:hypothetical protein